MIELNLIEVRGAQTAGIGPVLEVCKAVNWIVVGIAALVYFGGDWYLHSQWESEQNAKKEESEKLNNELSNIRKENRKNKGLKEMKEAYDKQAKTLESRTTQINEIIQLKINPQRILERIATDIPDTVWLSSIELSPNKTATIQGEAKEYKSIGEFMAKLNESKFFNRSLKLQDSSTVEITVNGAKHRVQKFKVGGTISTYD